MVKYPEDWKVVPLSDVGDVCMCKRVLKSETSTTGDIPFYKIGTFGKTPDAYISRDLYEAYRRAYSYPKTGDVLISAAGTIGRTVVFDGADAYFQDSNIVWLNNPETTVTNDYLYWCYQTVRWQTEDGGIVARLYNGNFRATKVPLPPLPEQKRIAAVLGNVDKLIDNLSRRIEKKRLVKQGVMQDLLTAKKRLPGFSGEWKRVKLGEIGAFTKGSGISRAEADSGELPAVRYGELYTNHSDYVKKYYSKISISVAKNAKLLSRGDVVFAASGETEEEIGKSAAIMDDGVYAGGDLIVFSPREKTDPIFWGFLLNMPYVQAQKTLAAQGATVVHIRTEAIASIVVNIPDVAEQKAIAGVLGAMDGEIAKLEAKLAKYRLLKQGLMNDLLTGRVRV